MGAFDIGLNKRRSIHDAAINMAFSSKVHHNIEALVHYAINHLPVCYIAIDEMIRRLILYSLQVFQVSCIGQLIQIGDLPILMLPQNIVDEVAADETGATGYQ